LVACEPISGLYVISVWITVQPGPERWSIWQKSWPTGASALFGLQPLNLHAACMPAVRPVEPEQQKTPRRGGGALLGLLQGGENWGRGEAKPNLACLCGSEFDHLQLNPVGKVADWRITGASAMRGALSETCCRMADRALVQRERLPYRIRPGSNAHAPGSQAIAAVM
jgi:hypothetical protein